MRRLVRRVRRWVSWAAKRLRALFPEAFHVPSLPMPKRGAGAGDNNSGDFSNMAQAGTLAEAGGGERA